MASEIDLRSALADDLSIFFEMETDPEAIFMAGFTAPDPADRQAFDAHWAKILADAGVIIRTIVSRGQVAGYVLSYVEAGRPEVSYWLAKAYWGQGIATRALTAFLMGANRQRPIYARVAKDNPASLRVLEKCGFRVINQSRGFANARGQEIEELLLELGPSTRR